MGGKSVRVRRWTGRFKQGGLIFSVFKNIVSVPTAFERGVDGVHIEAAIGEKPRLFLFVFQIGGGLFEFFAQHGDCGLQFARFVGYEFAADGFVYALLRQCLFQAQGTVLAAFVVNVGFGVALVGLPVAFGKFIQHVFQFFFAFGIRGELALKPDAADFLSGKDVHRAGAQGFWGFHAEVV